ncbi:hypothetical protein SNT97_001319 [Salmonella enterica]|nr:hypothetical protein [Salmonella enterica]ELU0790692.1 hypothetical protein [Salmonella enterica]ELY7574953.1 hypothetical protein [Salmonella enterica]
MLITQPVITRVPLIDTSTGWPFFTSGALDDTGSARPSVNWPLICSIERVISTFNHPA